MKKIFVLVLLLCAGVAAQAQERSQVVKFNPLSLLLSTFNVSYEHAISENKSVQLGAFYTGVGLGDFQYSGIGITPEVRFYLSEEVIDGIYVAPYLRYQNIAITESLEGGDSKFSSNILGAGAIIGRQWLLGSSDRVTLDIFLGPGYNAANFKAEDGGDSDDLDVNGSFDGFSIRTGLTLGVAF